MDDRDQSGTGSGGTPAATPAREGRRRLLLGGSAVAAVVLAGGIGYWIGRDNAPDTAPGPAQDRAVAPPADANLLPPIERDIRALPEAEQLARGFRAAFGSFGRATLTLEGSRLTFEPGRLLWLDDKAVLISPGTNGSDCHACAGALAVHYLRPAGEGFELAGSWPGAVRGWGWGAPPAEWRISRDFTSHPAILAQGGFTGQGRTCSSAVLTELRPDGPVESGPIWTGYDDEGAITDEHLARGERVQRLNGEIANIRRDRSFEVRFAGTDRFTERYVRRGNRFVAASETRLPC